MFGLKPSNAITTFGLTTYAWSKRAHAKKIILAQIDFLKIGGSFFTKFRVYILCYFVALALYFNFSELEEFFHE